MSAAMVDKMGAFITGDESKGSHGEADVAMRKRIELFLDQADPEDGDEVIIDLRRLNKSKFTTIGSGQ